MVTFVKSVLIDFVRHDFSSAQTLSAGLAVQLKCPSLNVRKYGHPRHSNFALQSRHLFS